jgi:hypothetical protein
MCNRLDINGARMIQFQLILNEFSFCFFYESCAELKGKLEKTSPQEQ